MQVIDNKALLFNSRKAPQITALIPKSKILASNGDLHRIMVNWGFEEVQLLRNIGIKDVPSPILGKYQWPGVYTPFDHQRTTAEFLTLHPRCFVFNEAGTGKTSAAAWAADYLMKQGKVTRVLIVCPVSIMETAWRADLFRTVMHRTVAIAQGTKAQRQKIIANGYEFIIINFDGVKVVQKELAAGAFDLIIVDEANAVKSVQTERWKVLASLVQPNTRLWLMTGTPASQSPLDAYGLAKLVNPASVPRFFGAFRDQVMVKLTQYKWSPRIGATTIVHKALQPAIRFTKEECLDLPDLLYTSREVALTPQQDKYYNAIKKQMMAVAAGEEITAVHAAAALNKLLQISCGAVYADSQAVVAFDCSNRISVTMEIIEESSHKVIVFVPFVSAVHTVMNYLKEQGHTVECIYGDVGKSERDRIFTAFQKTPDPRVLVAIPGAMSHGLTLTAASTIVWYAPITSADTFTQANGRITRPGQKQNQLIVMVEGSDIERKYYARLEKKQNTQGTLLETIRAARV